MTTSSTQEFFANTGFGQVLYASIGSVSAMQYDTTNPWAPQSLARPPFTPIVPTSDSLAADVP